MIDGRQRLTTLAKAARGDYPLRWNGEGWVTGNGVMELTACLHCASEVHDLYATMFDAKIPENVIREAVGVHDRMYFYTFTILYLQTSSLTDVVETYRRLATCGRAASLLRGRVGHKVAATR